MNKCYNNLIKDILSISYEEKQELINKCKWYELIGKKPLLEFNYENRSPKDKKFLDDLFKIY